MLRLLNRIGLTTWKRRILALLIVFPLLGIGSVELTSQSWFCNSCHIMNPYYDSWNKGTHKNVACVKCHIAPGADNFLAAKFNGLGQVVDDVLHRTSMKPSASVSAMACMRSGCHDLGKLKTSKKESGKFLFAHDKHIDLEYQGIKLACTTCHSHVKGDEHFQVDTNVCVTCHLIKSDPSQHVPSDPKQPLTLLTMGVRDGMTTLAAHHEGADAAAGHPPVQTDAPAATSPTGEKVPPASCVKCHNPPAQTIERGGLKITHSEYLSYGAACESCHRGNTVAPVPIENGHCYECHTFGLEKLTSVTEMHKAHLQGEHKIECFSCHGTVHHGPAAQTAKLEQFDCRQCHVDQHGVQRKTYLHNNLDASMTVSPMFMAHVDCTGCHIKRRAVSVKPDSGATVAAATPEACDACHKPGFGASMVPLWQKTTRTLYDQVGEEWRAADERASTDEAKAAVDEARKLLEMVRVDGSWGVHNPKYTQQILELARKKLKDSGAAPASKEGGR